MTERWDCTRKRGENFRKRWKIENAEKTRENFEKVAAVAEQTQENPEKVPENVDKVFENVQKSKMLTKKAPENDEKVPENFETLRKGLWSEGPRRSCESHWNRWESHLKTINNQHFFLNLWRGKGEDELASNSKAPDLAERAML